MINSFLKFALRYLWRKRTYSILNFVCLTFGLTCSIITVLYIKNVFSYDKFHKNYERLYAVDAWVTYFNGDRFPKQYLSASLTDMLKEQAPEIEEMTRIAEREFAFTDGDKTFTENGFYADPNFFAVFTFPLLQTGGQKILADPNSIVISESMANKLFKNHDCLGKSLIVKDGSKQAAYKVAGVFRDVPSQSLMQFDFVIPFQKFLEGNSQALEPGATACETWVLLRNNADRGFLENKIKDLIRKQEVTLNQELFLFPLKEHILYTYAGGKRVWKEMQNIVIIGTIGFVILLIACFNFINLAIALNVRRYREAGIRKVAGSGKQAIVLQFLAETFIITMISLLSALILTRILLIGFNSAFNYDIHLRLTEFSMIVFLLIIILFTCIVSGLLPALYLASSNPLDALKGKLLTNHSYSFFRQSLIVFQFTIPVVLIICMMIIRAQDSYMRRYDIGVDKDNLIIMNNNVNIQSHAESFKADLLTLPGIEAVSFTNCIPTRGAKVSSDVNWDGKDATEKLHFWFVNSDFDYSKAVRVNIIDGRFFNSAFSTDSVSYLINDVAARIMKMTSPVGSAITIEGRKGTIIGVFKDFHSIDLAGPVVPTIMRIKNDEAPIILIKFSSVSFKSVSGEIRKVYQHYDSEVPFQASLFGDLTPYSNLILPSRLVGLAFIIALLLGCMGLFGLASFTSENRTKEIGIRKANGATTLSVLLLLFANYTRWLVIAVIIALPIAFLLGRIFLGRFNFHTPMPLWVFFAGPLIAMSVTLLTVGSQTWRAADQNPIKALRYE
jgi:putative ABC transport system permease protein